MEEYKLNVYSEICCDMCHDIVHNHFDCPVCSKTVGSDVYDDLHSNDYKKTGKYQIGCVKCHTQFTTNDDPYDYYTNWEKLVVDIFWNS